MMIGSYLPEDMVREILLRLPVRSLLRFQAVCKQWLALITTSNFVGTHSQHSPKQSIVPTPSCSSSINYSISLLSDGKSRHDTRVISSSMISRGDACIIGSANGLVCLSVTHRSRGSIIGYILWNPATRVYRHLPSSLPQRFKRFSNFGGYPRASGFGFHPEIKDYKLLNVLDDTSSECLKAEVFTLRTGSWKQVKQTNPFGKCTFLSRESSVVVKGIWYHIALVKPIKDQSTLSILKFDMVSDAFSKMEVGLPYDEIGEKNISLMVYKELLAVSAYQDEELTWKLDIWTMKNECWTKILICRSPFPKSVTTSGYWHYEKVALRPLGILNDKEIILLQYSWPFKHCQMHLYDPLTQKLNMIRDQLEEVYPAAAHSYVESLVSVYGTSGIQVADDDGSKTKKEII